jgi:hypothetical protein
MGARNGDGTIIAYRQPKFSQAFAINKRLQPVVPEGEVHPGAGAKGNN